MKKMKSKGFTLIEIILCLSIMCIIFSYSLINYSGFGKLRNKIYVESFTNSLINFINNSKSYCRDNDIEGCIYFDSYNNRITFNSHLSRIYTLKVPDGFNLNYVRDNNTIQIDNRGITGDACTIKFMDRERKEHSITMCVGTSYVEVKE